MGTPRYRKVIRRSMICSVQVRATTPLASTWVASFSEWICHPLCGTHLSLLTSKPTWSPEGAQPTPSTTKGLIVRRVCKCIDRRVCVDRHLCVDRELGVGLVVLDDFQQYSVLRDDCRLQIEHHAARNTSTDPKNASVGPESECSTTR